MPIDSIIAAATFSCRDLVHTANQRESPVNSFRPLPIPLQGASDVLTLALWHFSKLTYIASPSRSQDRPSKISDSEDAGIQARIKLLELLALEATVQIIRKRGTSLEADPLARISRWVAICFLTFSANAVLD